MAHESNEVILPQPFHCLCPLLSLPNSQARFWAPPDCRCQFKYTDCKLGGWVPSWNRQHLPYLGRSSILSCSSMLSRMVYFVFFLIFVLFLLKRKLPQRHLVLRYIQKSASSPFHTHSYRPQHTEPHCALSPPLKKSCSSLHLYKAPVQSQPESIYFLLSQTYKDLLS